MSSTPAPQLSSGEQAAVQHAIARVRQRAAGPLQQAVDAGQAVAFIHTLHRGLDDVARRAAAQGPQPDCQAGCSYCCHLRVEATQPELLLIARWLRAQPAAHASAGRAANLLPDLLHALRRGVAARAALPAAARQPCVLLSDEGRCSIYAVRPAACRKAHSLSVQQCAAQAPQIPQNLQLLLQAEVLVRGTAQAYRDAGLPASPQELTAGLLAVLADAHAEAQWFQQHGAQPCQPPTLALAPAWPAVK